MAYFGGEKYVLFYFLLLPINRWKLRAYCDDKVKKKTKQTILQSNNWKKTTSCYFGRQMTFLQKCDLFFPNKRKWFKVVSHSIEKNQDTALVGNSFVHSVDVNFINILRAAFRMFFTAFLKWNFFLYIFVQGAPYFWINGMHLTGLNTCSYKSN